MATATTRCRRTRRSVSRSNRRKPRSTSTATTRASSTTSTAPSSGCVSSPASTRFELWLDGYRTVRQKVYLTPDNTFRVKYTMEKLPPASGRSRSRSRSARRREGGDQPRMQPPRMGAAGRVTRGRHPPPPPQQQPRSKRRRAARGPEAQPAPANGAYGTLAIRVQPGDAEVSIDGEAWRGPGGAGPPRGRRRRRLAHRRDSQVRLPHLRDAGRRSPRSDDAAQRQPARRTVSRPAHRARWRAACCRSPRPPRRHRRRSTWPRRAVAGADDRRADPQRLPRRARIQVHRVRSPDVGPAWAATPASCSPTRSSSAAAATVWSPTPTAGRWGTAVSSCSGSGGRARRSASARRC